MWSHVKDIWLKTRNRSLLQYLTCSGYGSYTAFSSLMKQFPQDQRQNISVIRSHIDIFHSIIMKHSKTDYILEKILTLLETSKPK